MNNLGRKALHLLLTYFTCIEAVMAIKVRQLLPLDSQTCESEVLLNTYQHNQVCNSHSFDTQPLGFPFRSMVLDGLSYVDSRVDFITSSMEHYSVQGLFYFTQENGVLIHYSADQKHRDFKLSLENGKFRCDRKSRPLNSKTYTGSASIVLNTWYYISASVEISGYVNVYINGTRDIYGEIGNRNSVEVPGNLRIGKSLYGSGTALRAKVACVGFFWEERQPLITEVQPLCETTPWTPTRHSNNLYFSYKNDTSLFPKPISSVQRCSLLQCAYSCLQDLQCYYIYYDGPDEPTRDCSTCYMYSRVETTGLNPQTQTLFKVTN